MRQFKRRPGKTAAFAALCATMSCGDVREVVEPEPSRAASVSISPSRVELGVPGEKVEFVVTVLDQHGDPMPAAFTWTSEDASVVSVDQKGVATAVSRGATEITVVAGDASAVARASVNDSAAGVCGRTPQVRDAITAAASRSDCAQVNAGLLERIRRLDVSGAGAAGAVAADCAEAFGEAYERGGARGRCGAARTPPGGGMAAMNAADGDGESERILSLRNGDFEGLRNLRFLDLGHNHLRGLPDGVFDDNPALDTLHLQENLLASLPGDVFGALTGLEHLDLSENALTVLPDGVFDGLAELERLALERNWITALPDGVFDDLAELERLTLEGNWIAALPDGPFDGLSRLTTLDLSNNRLSRLPDGAFRDLTGLKILNLSGNLLAELPDGVFDNVADATELYLTDNLLSVLPEGAFDGLADLGSLSLAMNRLTELPDGAFDDLASLDRLTVTRNRLTDLPDGVFDGLADLDYLSFSFNELTELTEGLLDGLGDLDTLYMSANDLARLPDGAFRGTPDLNLLSVFGNALTELPRGAFVGMTSLETLRLEDNLVDPFPLTLEAVRTDARDPLAEGPARIGISVREGAPFDMRVTFGVRGGRPRSTTVTIAAGDTISRLVTATRRGDGVFQFVAFDSLPATPASFSGTTPTAGHPLVLANPPNVKVEAKAAYLVQAAQSYDGKVPLVAGRKALLRVFATADYVNAYRPAARATFHLDGRKIHEADLTVPPGLPKEVDESSLNRSFNAMIPGSVLRPGVEMVVEIDPDGTLPTHADSRMRIPETGRKALDVRTLPPLDVTLVPVALSSQASRGDNAAVAALVREMADGDPRGTLGPTRALLPLADLNVRAREPYVTHADTLDGGGIELLDEIRLLRFIEAGATNEYYHGILAWPASRHPFSWGFAGVAYLSASAGLTLSHIGGLYYTGFPETLAHELGHNLSLRHAPGCGAGGPDPSYPYSEAFTGVWGVDFDTGGDFGRLISPARYRDFMSYCDPSWVSDFSFAKALRYRTKLPPLPAAGRSRNALLLWGRIRDDGTLRLEPVFEWDAPAKLPASPGPYLLEGVDAAGARMFSMNFAPDRIDHHGGAGFLFAVPAREGWADEIERVTLTGPKGFAALERGDGGGRGAIVASRATGRVLSIVRDWAGDGGAEGILGAAAEVSVSPSVLVRERRR